MDYICRTYVTTLQVSLQYKYTIINNTDKCEICTLTIRILPTTEAPTTTAMVNSRGKVNIIWVSVLQNWTNRASKICFIVISIVITNYYPQNQTSLLILPHFATAKTAYHYF